MDNQAKNTNEPPTEPRTDGKDKEILPGNKWLQYELSKYFGYMALVIMSLLRYLMAVYGEAAPVGPSMMYPITSLKIKPEILKVVLVFITQTYIDSLVFPNFNKPYEADLASHINYDIAINGAICIIIALVTYIVPKLGFENRKKAAM